MPRNNVLKLTNLELAKCKEDSVNWIQEKIHKYFLVILRFSLQTPNPLNEKGGSVREIL